LLFPKVIFNGQNQIGRPVAAYTLTQFMDDLTGLTYVTSVEQKGSICPLLKCRYMIMLKFRVR